MESGFDFSKFCRLCLSQDRILSKIFSENETENIELPLTSVSSKILACVGIEVLPGENLPDKICNVCLDQVENWVKFKELCDNANSLLIQYSTGIPPITDEVLEKNLQRSNSEDLNIPETSSDFCLGDVSLLEHDSWFRDFDDSKQENVPCSQSFSNNNFSSLFKQDNENNKSEALERDESLTKKNSEEEALKEINRAKWREKYSKMYTRKYNCDLCSKVFTKFNNLLKHDREDHKDIPPVKSCEKCDRLFISEQRLEIHILMKHRDKNYECDICGVKCVSEKSLSIHKLRHSGRFDCNICGKPSNNKKSLEEHIQQVHAPESQKTIQMCNICNPARYFTHPRTLQQHLKLHNNYLGFQCNLCSKQFKSQDYLSKHKLTHSTEKNAICEECGSVFKNERTLYIHKLTHKGKSHMCSVCDKTFHTKNLLSRHLLVHGAQPYRCYICHKAYNRADTLAMHLKLHTNSEEHKCSLCGQTFSLRRYLKSHMLRIHKEEEEEEEEEE